MLADMALGNRYKEAVGMWFKIHMQMTAAADINMISI